MEKKMTYATAIDNALALGTLDAETATRLEELKASLAKRNAKKSDKPSKEQIANAEFAEKVYATMEDGVKYQCKVLGEQMGVSASKISGAFSHALKGRVEKTVEKGVSYYTKVVAE